MFDSAFYQSKYEFYRKFSFAVVIFASLASVTYFISDCQLFGRLAVETALARFIIIIPMMLYIILYSKCRDYRVMVPVSYAVIHCIMWNTIWAIYFLPDKSHAVEGFIIMHLMFLALGFIAPFKWATAFHVLVIVNILVSNTFNHYESLDLMLSLGVPCVVAICAIQYFMQGAYYEHYVVVNKLERMSRYDMLTGAYNRYIIEDITDEKSVNFTESMPVPSGMLLLDIDHFKKVNDTYGHIAGDSILKQIIEVVFTSTRSTDYCIRWGGEEFLILLPGCGPARSRNVAETIRSRVEHMNTGICPVTVSLGVITYEGGDYKGYVARCDEALYRAKNTGRNKVVAREEF